ncbi:hypothetical protein LJC61_04385 [Ruminococcaceae bacterium OttesenSCG-928-A16]|nr:hypothetical protein [Ruminococcaceae bacterium OttesenSCG-928-A16]
MKYKKASSATKSRRGKKIMAGIAALLLVVFVAVTQSPVISAVDEAVSEVVTSAAQVAEPTSTPTPQETEPASVPLGEETVESEPLQNEEPAPEVSPEPAQEAPEDTPEETEEQAVQMHTVTFVLPQELQLIQPDAPTTVEVEDGETLQAQQIPNVQPLEPEQATFAGWQYGESVLSSQELAALPITQDSTFTAVATLQPAKRAINRAVNGWDASINGAIKSTDTAAIVVLGLPYVDGTSYYKAYTANEVNLKQALYDLSIDGDGGDYAIYIGTTVSSTTAATHIGRYTNGGTATNISLTALTGKVDTLVFVGLPTDPDTPSTIAPIGARTINFTTGTSAVDPGVFAGCNLVFRNINYTGSAIYMNGYSLTLDRGSYGNGFTVYGGLYNTAVSGSPTITVNSTGSGTWNFFGGGNTSASSLEGSPTIIINNTSGAINQVVGGANAGSVTGDTNVIVNGTGNNSAITTLVGGGYSGSVAGNVNTTVNNTGTTASTTANIANVYGGSYSGGVNGNVTTVINSTRGNIGTYYGGANSGTITGNITNNLLYVGGNLGPYYGGGFGATAAAKANVTGSVSNSIRGLKGTLGAYYGGVYFGNIDGPITNLVDGPGSRAANATFIGGSYNGNIGTDETRGTDIITTTLDTSAYTAGSTEFAGANAVAGVIKGNINNLVTAGDYSKGSFVGVQGGGALGTLVSGYPTSAVLDSKPDEERADFYKTYANFQVYGNISTELTKGCFSHDTGNDGYARAAGFGGYIEGDTTIVVGTQGFCYSGSRANANMEISSTLNQRGYYTTWDIVGGGGNPTGRAYNNIYIKGNTTAIIKNALARWTYGGNFSGVIQGNTRNEMWGGVVDTCEGAGFEGSRIYGNSSAYMYGGQVDWFLSGGGWWDEKITGNVYVEVWNGQINASMGGTYGNDANHVIGGNSTIKVYGGNFDGLPSHGTVPDGFCGGASQAGYILGNSEVTLDLRAQENVPAGVTQGEFVLPSATSIAGGRRYGAGDASYLGTDANNTITLNIFTDPGSDVLKGANIYGDGGVGAASTRSGKITVNINAPDSTLGSLYATQYNNVNGASLRRDVTVNLQDAKAVSGISGGSTADNFTNAVIAGTANRSVFNVGPGAGYSTISMSSSGVGMVNFTSLNIDGKMLMATGASAATGSIKNGLGATATLHRTDYNTFGDITMKNDGGIGISSSNAIISAGKFIIEGVGTLSSPPGDGLVNITDFVVSEGGHLQWYKTGDTNRALTGTWFGYQSKAYQVLTLSSNQNGVDVLQNALKITPATLRGIDKNAGANFGKTYIGDNDVVTSTLTPKNGYGIAIAGSYIDFEVTAGEGLIQHNMDNVSMGPPPPTISVYGTVGKETPVAKGTLAIPLAAGLPTLTFLPETTIGEWIKGVQITKSDNSTTSIGEQETSDPQDWTSPDGEYSYSIQAQYTNQAELLATDAIITEDEAAAIVDANDVLAYNQAGGRPFFGSNIDDADDPNAPLLEDIRKALEEGQYYRIHPITYHAGIETDPDNYIVQTVNLIVIKNGAVLSDDRSAALFAKDATMQLQVANALGSQAELDANHTMALVVHANGTTESPVIDDAAMGLLQGATDKGTVPVTYTYTPSDEVAPLLTANVTITITTTVAFNFYKVDAQLDENGDTIYLAGAGFALYSCPHTGEAGHTHAEVVAPDTTGCWQPLLGEDGLTPVVASSGNDGYTDLGGLQNGDYMLVETTAPTGYEKPSGQWYLQVDNTVAAKEDQIILTAKGRQMPMAFGVAADGTLQLPNMRQIVIPTSGAEGTTPFIIVGLFIMGGATTLLLLAMRKRRAICKNPNGGGRR